MPRKQWIVGREFNRRIKNAFDSLGIEMPYVVKPAYLAEREALTEPGGLLPPPGPGAGAD